MTARIVMKLLVTKVRHTTRDVLHIVLKHPLKSELPEWTAGAHVDLRLPDGRVRQYSLCGDPNDRSKYEIAVKREQPGRGGSKWVHDNLSEGAIAHVSAPRNNLPLSQSAHRHIIVAGGIGITPFLSMARTLEAQKVDYVVHFCAPSPHEAPLLSELNQICGSRLQCWFSKFGPRFDIALIGRYSPGTHIYICGPERLVDAVRAYVADWPAECIHCEVFQATLDENFNAEPFEVTIASNGLRLLVPANKSLLEVLRDSGFVMPSSCELGICGSCECGYRDGVVIHRDKALPISKRQDRLLPCVSRARVSVTLDL